MDSELFMKELRDKLLSERIREHFDESHLGFRFYQLLNEIEQLQNNWNKLKEWLNDYLNREFPDNVDLKLYMFCEMVMDKMQEIEGGVDNE